MRERERETFHVGVVVRDDVKCNQVCASLYPSRLLPGHHVGFICVFVRNQHHP